LADPRDHALPWETPDVPVEVRREVFLRLSEQIGTQLTEHGASEQEASTISLPAAVVADANFSQPAPGCS
jgi:hypothetical protein